MSDREMRELLHQVMDDIEKGRVRRRWPRGSRLGRLIAPPLLAASLGLAGCTDTGVGAPTDAAVSGDAITTADAAYMAPFDAALDAGPQPEYMGPPFDAAVDSGPEPPYMAPPYDAGPEPDYMAPFDAAVDDDGGAVPLYMGPPPEDD